MANIHPDPYKLGEVYIGPNESFVDYAYYSLKEGKYKRDKARLGIKGLGPEKQKAALQSLCDRLNAVMKERNKKGLYHEDLVAEQPNFDLNQTIPEALLFVRDSNDEDLSDDRKDSMRETAGSLQSYYKDHPPFSSKKIIALEDTFLKHFIKWCKEKEKTGKTINKYLSSLQFATEWLKRKEYIKEAFSTVPLRVDQPRNESGRFPPLTHQEKVRAFAWFKSYDVNYHHFLFWEYYTCIRGSEIYRVQRSHIDFKNKTIFLPWLNTKNGVSNYVQILQPLYDLLLKLGIDKLPQATYIFGEKFLPSLIKYKGSQSSNKWANHRKNMDMPKEKQAYGLKHTFNVDYVENNKYNIDWEWLRRHNRHATIQQTMEYISTLTAYFLDETKSVILNYYI